MPRKPNDPITIHLSPAHKAVLGTLTATHNVSVSSILSALWTLGAAAPPEHPPAQSLRRRGLLAPGERYLPVMSRPTEAMAAARVLTVPTLFINTSTLTAWCLDTHRGLVADYYAQPADADALRKEVIAAAKDHVALPQPEPVELPPPAVHDPLLGKTVPGPCPVCPADKPHTACEYCAGAGTIRRTLREWCVLRQLKVKAGRAARKVA